MGPWLHHVVWGGLAQCLYQVVFIAGPFVLLGLLLHGLEGAVQGRLSRRFGWKSVLWTGWLGTPVHELSHALFCLLFRHRIEEIALFRPDPSLGRLGYVNHTYDPRSRYQVVGNFFIGTAPFLGGALALYGLLWLFDPRTARHALSGGGLASAVAGGNLVAGGRALWEQSFGVLSGVITWDHLSSLPFWFFLYGVLCIGSHTAPSGTDYRGAREGGAVLLGALLVLNVLFLALGGRAGAVTAAMAGVTGPALALMALASVLCLLAAGVVMLLTDVLFVSPWHRQG